MPTAQASLSSLFKADPTKPIHNTRKRGLDTTSRTNDKENTDLASASDTEEPTAPKRAKSAPKKSTAKKDASKKPASKTAVSRPKTPKKQYNDAKSAATKDAKALEKKGANTDKISEEMAYHLPQAAELLALDTSVSTMHAFVFVLYLAEHSVADLHGHHKACGYGEHRTSFAAIDDMMLKVIEQRVNKETNNNAAIARQQLPSEGTGDVAFALEKYQGSRSAREPETFYEFQKLVGKKPNKQERNQVERYRREGNKERADKRRMRREQEESDAWVANALADSKAFGSWVDKFGIETT